MARAGGDAVWVALVALVLSTSMARLASAQSTGDSGGSALSNEQRPSAAPNAPSSQRPDTPPQARPAWMNPLTERDKVRIENIVESRTEGRRRAALDASNRHAQAAIALLDRDAIPLNEKQLLGDWQCRTYGLGGTLYPNRGADVSGPFRCRIERDRNGLVLRKLTGSVTWLARLAPVTAHSLLYYGTYIARGDRNAIYPAGDAYHHQVGILQQLDRRRLRIEMPKPTHYATSDHDVVELFRDR